MTEKKNYLRDRLSNLASLLAIAIVVHIFYVLVVTPTAEAWMEEQRAIAATNPGYTPQRSLFVIIQDGEQEATIIVSAWALLLAALRAVELARQRKLLDADLIEVPDGVAILPDDVREYSRRLESLPAAQRNAVVPRVLRLALKRFGATRDVQDASTTVHNVCESEAARLDSELAILRFSVWATPALGFVGTVRGIGLALQGAQLAFKGDTTAVTSGLGVSFNSTLIALSLSIVLMYVLHEIQQAQESLVLDAEHYADERLISRMHGERTRTLSEYRPAELRA
jgi:biopolymer transport protein ExbB/TolQ